MNVPYDQHKEVGTHPSRAPIMLRTIIGALQLHLTIKTGALDGGWGDSFLENAQDTCLYH